MRPASIKETKNGYNDENYITPRTLRAALADYSPGGGGSSEGGTTDYNKLENKPSINGVTLSQNKTLKDLGIQPEGAYLTEVPDAYKTKDENDRLYQPKGSYQPAGSYQETLVSGDNIKTVNGQSLLGEGDLTIAGGEGGGLIDTLPVGTMIPYGSAKTPDNWLSCNGQAVSRTTYSHLFEVIGTSYGAGDGSTTFNLPDKRGRVSVGYDPDQAMFNKVGAHVGANTHTLTVEEMPSHSHNPYRDGTGDTWTWTATWTQNNGKNSWDVREGSFVAHTGGGKAHSILQASEVDHWIIKAFPLSSPEDTLDSLPVGTIIEYDGDEIPDGFELVENVSGDNFVKLDDGHTLECWGETEDFDIPAYTTKEVRVTLPESYRDVHFNVSTTVKNTHSYWASCAIAGFGVSANEILLAVYNNADYTARLSLSYRTIGKWR